MTTVEKEDLVRRLQAGKARARRERPAKLKAVERKLDEKSVEYREARDRQDWDEVARIRSEINQLGAERRRLQH